MRHAGAAVDGRGRAIMGRPVARPRTVRTTTIPTTRLGRAELPPPRLHAVAPPRRHRLTGASTDQVQRVLITGDAAAVLFGFYMAIFAVAAIGPSSWKELVAQMVAVTT